MKKSLTRPLYTGMPVYPGDPDFVRRETASVARDGYALSRLDMGAHNGTHIDAPAHYLLGGATIDSMPDSLMWGRAQAVERPGEIAPGTLRAILTEDRELSAEEARALLRKGVRLIVVPGLTVGNGETHRALLGGGCYICENACCAGLAAGEYELVCVPLPIRGGEAAPAAVLIRTGKDDRP